MLGSWNGDDIFSSRTQASSRKLEDATRWSRVVVVITHIHWKALFVCSSKIVSAMDCERTIATRISDETSLCCELTNPSITLWMCYVM